MRAHGDVSRLIDDIYAAGEDPSLWPRFLDDISDTVGSKMTVLLHQDREQRATVSSGVRIDPEWVRLYQDHYAAKNIFFIEGKADIYPGSIVLDSCISEQRLLASEYYNDFLAPQDARYSAGIIIFMEGGRMSLLSTMRSREAGPFEEAEVRLLHTLRPHLQRSFQIHRRLFEAERRANLTEAALDRLGTAIVLIGADKKISFMNRRAAALIAGRDGLSEVDGKLCPASRSDARTFESLLVSALRGACGEASDGGGVASIERPSGRRAYNVLVAPVPPKDGVDRHESAAAMVMITDPAEQETMTSVVGRLHGLTTAETRIAEGIVQGRTPQEIAAEAGISLETVRTHLKRIFRKTSTRRQAELVRLFANGQASMIASSL